MTSQCMLPATECCLSVNTVRSCMLFECPGLFEPCLSSTVCSGVTAVLQSLLLFKCPRRLNRTFYCRPKAEQGSWLNRSALFLGDWAIRVGVFAVAGIAVRNKVCLYVPHAKQLLHADLLKSFVAVHLVHKLPWF